MHHKINNTSHKLILFLIVSFSIIVFLIFPDFFIKLFSNADYKTPTTILLFLPGFFVLLAIVEVLIPQEWVIQHLGKHSGFKGGFWAFVLGSFLPGPVFLAFPLSAILLKKGVSKFNVILFISAWACFNVTEEIFEIHFLGWKFFLLRFIITVPLLILLSFVMEKWSSPKITDNKN